jgi:hypothetical protein
MSHYADQLHALQQAILGQGSHSRPALQPHDRLSEAEQIAIYAEGYHVRLTHLLRNSYPATLHLIGERPFHALAEKYIAQHPSHMRNIDRYALPFADFLAQNAAGDDAISLIRLEQASHKVFLLPDCEPMTAAHFQQLSEAGLEDSPLPLRKSACLLATPQDAQAYLSAFRSEEQPLPAIHAQPSYCLLYRHNRQVQREILSLQDYRLLKWLHRGESFGSALEKLSQDSEKFDIHPIWLQKFFQNAVKNGYFSSCDT